MTPCATSRKARNSCPPDSLGTPDIMLLQCEEVAVIDNLSGSSTHRLRQPGQAEAYSRAKKRLRQLKDQLRYSVSAPQIPPVRAIRRAQLRQSRTTWTPCKRPRS
jgi:anthranilate/para-aminobenzoate synthase component I